MEFKITRNWPRPTYTVGIFWYQEVEKTWKRLCNTLEDAIRDLIDKNQDNDFDDPGEGKVYGKTAIPCGRYPLVLHYWVKQGKEYPMILNIPGFTGVYIHSGNTAEDTLGCPLVGDNVSIGLITNGRYYTAKIVEMLEGARMRNEDSFITIEQ